MFFFICSSLYLGFHDPIWRAYFSDGLKQPPSEMMNYSRELTYQSWGSSENHWLKKCRLGKEYVSFLGWWFYIVYSLHSRKPCWRTCWVGTEDSGTFNSLGFVCLVMLLRILPWDSSPFGRICLGHFFHPHPTSKSKISYEQSVLCFHQRTWVVPRHGLHFESTPPNRMPEWTFILGFPLTKI